MIASIDSPSTSFVYNELFSRYIRGYDHLPAKSGITSNMLCLFLRYALTVCPAERSNEQKQKAESVPRCFDVLKRDFRQNPECYNARAVSSAIYSLTRSSFHVSLFAKRRAARERVSERADRPVRFVLPAARRRDRIRHYFHGFSDCWLSISFRRSSCASTTL